MKEQIISYETAKLAFECGYPVFDNINKTNYYNRKTKNIIYFGRTGTQTKEHLYGAPTQSLLQKWLREKHNIIVNTYVYKSYTTPNSNTLYRNNYADYSFFSWEGVLEDGLKIGLKILKSK